MTTVEQTMADVLFYQVMPMIRNIDDNIDTHLYQEFYNGTTKCYQLITVGAYNIIYIPYRKQVVVAFRLENDGSWGSGTYFDIENEDLFPPTMVKEACIDFARKVGL